MRVIYDKGKKYGLYRFLKFASNKQLDEYDESWIIICLSILACSAVYSFKHKCWIFKN